MIYCKAVRNRHGAPPPALGVLQVPPFEVPLRESEGESLYSDSKRGVYCKEGDLLVDPPLNVKDIPCMRSRSLSPLSL